MKRDLGASPALAEAEPVARLGPAGFDPERIEQRKTDTRSLSEIAARQQMDWDRYAGSLRREVEKLGAKYPGLGPVSSCCDHISLLLDEVEALRHDIRRAYDIANEYLNDTMRLRKMMAAGDLSDAQ